MAGRPRLFRDSIPAHIDQAKIPRGCFWDKRDGYWYVIHRLPKPRRQRIADLKATLSDLHRLMEDIAGVARGTVIWVLDEFHASPKFQKLAASTQKDYEKYRNVARTRRTRSGLLGELPVARLSVEFMQAVIDAIAAEGTPTKANHLQRYLRRSFAWGMRYRGLKHNPCAGVEQAEELKRRVMPTTLTHLKVLAFCQERGARTEHRAGSVAPYLWPAMEIAYLCRLRGAEVVMLNDAHFSKEGLLCNRLKGSRSSMVEWSPRLRAAWDAAIARRTELWTRRARPVPMRAEDRPLFVAQDGVPLRKGTLDSAWQTMIKLAIADGVITAEERFSMHGFKRRGITDTPGTRGEKQLASGHRTEAMLDVYDQSVPVVRPAGEK